MICNNCACSFLLLNNCVTHNYSNVKTLLAKHLRFQLHVTPTSASWLNLVERWFGKITTDRIRRGAFKNVAELEQAIADYIEHNNKNPQPFVWTKSANEIILKVNQGRASLGKPPLAQAVSL